MDLALRFADWALKSTVLLLVAGLVVLALHRRSAAVRHLVWALALGAVLILPALSLAAPRWSPPLPLPQVRVTSSLAEGRPADDGAGVAAPRTPAVWLAEAQASPVAGTGTESFSRVSPGTGRAQWVASAGAVAGRALASSAGWLGPLWLAGAALVLVTVAGGIGRTRWLRRAARPAPAEARSLMRMQAARLGLRRPVELLQLDGAVMPLTFGMARPVILLPADAATWPEDRLRAVLLHELAHVQRHDCLTQRIARMACAVYWFNPLAWLAARRLRVERELACDDLVLAAGSKASDYATHLLEIARGLRVGALAGVASIAMARPSQLAGRLLAVLDDSRVRRMVTARTAAGAMAAALAVMVPLAGVRTWESPRPTPAERADVAPALPWVAAVAPVVSPTRGPEKRPVRGATQGPAQASGCAWESSQRSTSASFNISNDHFKIHVKLDSCSLDVDGEGEVSFNEREDDVTALSRGGYFTIDERTGDGRHRVEFEQTGGGLQRRWFVDGHEQAYDDAARAWLAQTLLVVFRRTGFDAERRAQRLLQRGGVDGVLEEVSHVSSDYAARRYFAVLLTGPGLDQATLLRIVRRAGQQISSDFELASLLIAVAQHQPLEEPVRLAYVEAVGSIGSDFERHRALKAVLTRQGISRELAAAMLQAAQTIRSDFELASLLVEVAQAHTIDASLADPYFAAAGTIQSDFEKHRVLKQVLADVGNNQALLDRALEAAGDIQSDFELASLLTEVAQQYPPDQPLPAPFLKAALSIHSGFELRRALSTFVTRGGATPTQLASVLDAAAGISQDFELAQLLVALIQHYPLDDALRPAFFRAVGKVGASFERARVLKAVVARKPLTEPTVLAVLEAAAGIKGDFELAELLIATAKAYPVNERLRPAFLKAAESISSEHERGRVLSAIFPRGEPAD